MLAAFVSRGLLAALLLSVGLAGALATPADAAPLRRPWYPQDGRIFDLLLRTSDDPDLLTPRQSAMRAHLLRIGVDPRGPRRRPTLTTLFSRRLAVRNQWFPERPPRTRDELHVDARHGLLLRVRVPEFLLQTAWVDTNLVGIAFEVPPAWPDSAVAVSGDDLQASIVAGTSRALLEQWSRQVRNRQGLAGAQRDLLNFTIPIKLPRTLERIIGRGDKTNIRISGQESITIGGQSTVRSDFIGNELRQNQSYFPQLELQQTLRVNLDGTVGEKIKVRVSHNSEAVGAQATEVKLAFQGDEDDIVQAIRAGDIDVTLPGSRLLGVGASRGGLFGLKVEGALGPIEFTLVTSKEQAQQNDQTFNQTGGSEEEFLIRSVDYADRRFFRLIAPNSLYLGAVQGATEPAPIDGSGPFFATEAEGGAGWRIDFASLEVYLAVGSGIGDENFLDEAVALVDTTGIGWEGFGAGVGAVPGEDTDLVDVVTRYPASKVVRRPRWKRLLKGSDWDELLDPNGELIGVAMRRSYSDQDVLAVSYRIIDSQGNLVRKVGRSIDDVDGDPTIADPLDPTRRLHVFKLLKPGPQNDPYRPATGTFDPLALCWEYELRNYYDLRGRNIDLATLQLRIERNNVALERPDRDEETGPDGVGTNLPWIRVFGLDQLDASGNPGHDDVADVGNRQIVDPFNGILQFPVARPFDLDDATVSFFTDGQITALPAEFRFSDLYTRRIQTQNELAENTKFNIVVRQSSISSRLRLNAFNVRENSEEVVLDGRTLQRGVDYDIDYFSGEINLKGDALAALGPQSNVQVRFEVDPLFGGGRTSLSGMNLNYRFGRQNTLSTTWLYQTRPNNASKIRLGEEPKKNWVGNVAAKLRFEPRWLTSMANSISREDSDQKPSVSLDSEVAISLPDPNTRNEAYLEDFENVDQSVQVSMSREGWWWASLPVPDDGQLPYQPENRAYVGWHRAVPGLKRGDINPTLSEQEQRDVLTSMEMRIVARDTTIGWQADEYAGIMRSLGEVDLTQAQFLEFWIDDGTGYLDPDASEAERAAARPGRLHFDFGQINEDFFWPVDESGVYEINTWQKEDQDNDGLLGAPPGYGNEDRGLDRILSEDEILGGSTPIVGRPGRPGDPAGDDFSSEADFEGRQDVFVYINGTEGNRRLDSEDINNNGFLDNQDGYFELTLDLDDGNPLVDPYRDYADDAAFINDAILDGRSWRKYRLDLRQIAQKIRGNDGLGYSAGNPDLSRVRYLRIWYQPEGDGSDPVERRIKFAEMRFLGNRWVSEGVRDPYDQRLDTTQLGGQDFRLGVLNNKENADYVSPVEPRVRNNVEELEQSLEFVYTDLQPGSRVRARKDLPGREGQDYLQYGVLEYFWREPFRNGAPALEQRSLEAYYWVGSDSLNYYEIAFSFDEVEVRPDGWVQVNVDLGELTNVKNAPIDSLVAFPDSTGRENPEVRRAVIRDAVNTNEYRVSVRGRPDLRRVTRFYAGIRYPQDPTGTALPVTGEILFNEIRLKQDLDDAGFAQRHSFNAQVPGLGDVALEYSKTDEEFRGLNQDRGSGILRRNWSVRTSTRIQNFLPTFGLDIPITLTKRNNLQLPKYQTLSDIELLDNAARERFRSEDTNESYTVQIRKPRPSESKLLQYTIDRFQFSINGSRGSSFSPTQESHTKSADQKYNYDLRLRQTPTVPLPFTRARLGFLPNQVTLGSNWRYTEASVTELRLDGTRIERQPRVTKTNNNNLSLSFQPLQSWRGNYTMQSNRNLVLGSEKFLGLDIGKEETFNQRWSSQLKPEFGLVKWAKPSIDLSGGYREDRKPGIRQRASSIGGADDPDGDGFLGVPGQVRNIGNSSDLSVRGELDLTGWMKGWIEGRQRAARERSEQRRRLEAAAEAARAEPPPEAASPSPGEADEPEPDATEEGAAEVGGPAAPAGPVSPLPGVNAAADSVEAGPQSGPQETTPSPAGPSTGEDRARLLELARRQGRERQRQAQMLRQGQVPGSAASADSLPVPATALQAVTRADSTVASPAEADEGGPGLLGLVDLFFVRPFGGFFANLRPLTASWQQQKQSSYQHVNGRADALYRFGFNQEPDFSRIDPVVPDGQDFSTNSLQTTRQLRLNTQSQMTKSLRVDLSYSRRTTVRDGTRGLGEDRSVEWPNVSLRVSRVHEWKYLKNWLNSSNIDVSYKKTETIQNATASTATFPRVAWTLQPRWTFRLNSGLDTNLNVTISDDRAENTQSFQFNRQARVNLRLQQSFDATGRLAFLRFGQKGTGTTIDMNVDLTYSRQRNFREDKASGEKSQERGSNRWSLSPRFTYQFSRNLRGSMRFELSRSRDIARDATTTTLGLFLEGTLTF